MTGERGVADAAAAIGARAAAAEASGMMFVPVQIHGIFGSLRRRQSKGDTMFS